MTTTQFNNKIERINCPFDFTKTGRVGLNYAGMLASALDARLIIFYVDPSDGAEELQLYEDQNDSAKGIRRLLKLQVQDMAEKFGIEAEYAIEPTTNSLEVAVGSMSANHDLIVMGTNGADSLYHHVFGPHTHHLLGLTQCPVLLIPSDYDHHIPKQIVYACSSEADLHFLAGQLEILAQPLGAHVHTLHVEGHRTQVPARQTQLFEEVKETEASHWDFEPTYSDEIVASVDQFMKDSGAGVLALTYYHHLLFEKLLREKLLSNTKGVPSYPLLVFWH